MRKWIVALCFLSSTVLFAEAKNNKEAVLAQLKIVNQVPESQLSEKTEPGVSILRTLFDVDGPEFLELRQTLGKAEIRSQLNPSAKCVLAGLISQRWDTFTLSGNLYLAGIKSPNPELRSKSAKKLVGFIQPAHIPILIELLASGESALQAQEVLQEVTGQNLGPAMKNWQTWWGRGGSKTDLVGHLLNDTRAQLNGRTIQDFDQERFWYIPDGIAKAQTTYADRSKKEQMKISEWNNWARTDVRRYVEEWNSVKPILDRIIHQPDPRVTKFLETLVAAPGYGDYASIVLAWRSSTTSLPLIQDAYKTKGTVGRALARGSLGDKVAMVDLLRIIDRHQSSPLSYKIMDEDAHSLLTTLRTVGVIPAEQAIELLSHHHFDFDSAYTPKDKKKAFDKIKEWMKENIAQLSLDARRGYYTVPAKP